MALDKQVRRLLSQLWKPIGVVIFLLLVLGGYVLLWTGSSESSGRSEFNHRVTRVRGRSLGSGGGTSTGTIHVALCSDDPDLRAAAVAIRSAHLNCAQPERLVFHFITSPELAPVFQELFRAYMEGINVEVHSDQGLQDHISSSIRFRKSSKARKVLASPFNFAPFYIHQYIDRQLSAKEHPTRLIYIDTDTVIMGDMVELYDTDLQGHPCAAVKYCLQTMDHYINFDVMRDLGYTDYDAKACIANRGLLVIDVHRWTQLEITEKIEGWMRQYGSSQKDLWVGGMSQPPWLLAMNGDYLELGDEWNCNSLGRESMTTDEGRSLREGGFDHRALRKIGAKLDQYGRITPYVVTCSATGKMLHYNGAVKPWDYDKTFEEQKLPACAVPEDWQFEQKFNWKADVRVFCKPVTFVNCVELWTAYISEEAACALRDYDQEWPEELQWQQNLIEEEAKVDSERKAKQEQRAEKQEKNAEEIKARENSKAKIAKAEQIAQEADQREQEAESERRKMEAQEASGQSAEEDAES